MRSIAAAAFETTLDTFSVAVVLVDAKAHILHANAAARALFGARGPLLATRNELRTTSSAANQALDAAIARAAGE